MSFVQTPGHIYEREMSPALRDFYAGLRWLSYLKHGREYQKLETSISELRERLPGKSRRSRRTVSRLLAELKDECLIDRQDDNDAGEEHAPVTIVFTGGSVSAGPQDKNGTPAKNGIPPAPTTPPDPASTGPDPASTPDPSVRPGLTGNVDGPAKNGRGAKNGALLTDLNDDILSRSEDHHHQISEEGAKNGIPPQDKNGTPEADPVVLAELLHFGLEEAVAWQELAPACTLGQVQAGILAAMQELKREAKPRGLERASLPGWLVNRLRLGMWSSAAEIPPDRWMIIKARGYQEHDPAEQLEQKYRGGRYGHLVMH